MCTLCAVGGPYHGGGRRRWGGRGYGGVAGCGVGSGMQSAGCVVRPILVGRVHPETNRPPCQRYQGSCCVVLAYLPAHPAQRGLRCCSPPPPPSPEEAAEEAAYGLTQQPSFANPLFEYANPLDRAIPLTYHRQRQLRRLRRRGRRPRRRRTGGRWAPSSTPRAGRRWRSSGGARRKNGRGWRTHAAAWTPRDSARTGTRWSGWCYWTTEGVCGRVC